MLASPGDEDGERRRGIRPRHRPAVDDTPAPRARPLPLHNEIDVRILGGGALLLAALAILAVLLGSRFLVLPASIGLAIASIAWFVRDYRAAAYRGWLDSMAAGGAWVDWRHPAESWARFRARERWRARGRAAIGGAAIAVLAAVMLLHPGMPGDLPFEADYRTRLLLAAAAGVVWGLGQIIVDHQIRERHPAPPRSLVGPHGVYVKGRFWPVWSHGHRLVDARLATSPEPALRLRLRIGHGRNRRHRWIEIPIPPGAEDEAASVLARLQSRRG